MKPKDEDKKQVIAKIEEVMDKEQPFLILTGGDSESAVMMGGDFHDMARMVSIAMSKIEQLEMVVDAAQAALEYSRSKMDKKNDIDELLKCDTCDAKDECDIFNMKAKLDSGNFDPKEMIGEMAKLVADMKFGGIKSKGDC